MKIIHSYIIKSFLKPFLSTFFIAMFILILQLIWLAFDDLAGKGINTELLVKIIFYVSVIAIPTAIPIGILLASIMTLGRMAEDYEFAAMKSAGISLLRLITPLLILVTSLSVLDLFFLNNAYPWAKLKQKNLFSNIKKKEPTLALVEGTFNTDIPGYVIKFDEKYGTEDNLLKNVLIYQTDNRNGKINAITAQNGEILTDEGSKYMSLKLMDGFFYEEHSHRGSPRKERERAPFSETHFNTYTVNIDVSKFVEGDVEEEKYKGDREMLSFDQLNIYSDSLKIKWDKYVQNKADFITLKLKPNKLKDSTGYIESKELVYPIIDNFKEKDQLKLLETAQNNIDKTLQDFKNLKADFKYRRKGLNLIDTEFHKRIAIAFSALLLFLVGAPLGSLIKKGGFGLPMVFAIVIYLFYHFTSSFAGNMAEESTVNHIWGGWLSTIIFLPFGLFLLISATTDKAKINFGSLITMFSKWFPNKDKETDNA